MNALSGAAVLLMVITSTHSAIAAAIALREGSADWTANAFAGETAKAYDASTASSNPAGMTRLNWNEVDLSSTAVCPPRNSAASTQSGGRSHREI
jgi:long-chain fatty acid transport protein